MQVTLYILQTLMVYNDPIYGEDLTQETLGVYSTLELAQRRANKGCPDEVLTWAPDSEYGFDLITPATPLGEFTWHYAIEIMELDEY